MDTFDIAIVGGGPAGLSAALVLGRARRRVVVIDAGTPRNAPAAHMQGFLSRDGTPPGELIHAAREEVARYGVELVDDRVEDVSDGFTLRLASGRTVQAAHVLLATGATDELPAIEGARERWGRDFLHCPYCHGWEVRDQAIGVIGSVEHAHLLRQWSDDVILFPHTTPVPDAGGLEVVEGTIERLVVQDDRLRGVQLSDGRIVARDALFIRPAVRAHADGPATALGCDLLESGLVRVDPEGRTSVPGVWAAGNATNPRAQVITAAGEGSAVAIAINTALVANPPVPA
ncbi:NAD(P)/FAD-dependent oxidoreductase [Solirubrobacter taibaiensis]|nr:NAD(P)/FAD-dependent oxidoreductase [Solirubrobacter taibaiensis]